MCICPTFLKIEIEFNGYMALARLWNIPYLNEYIDHAEIVFISITYAVWDIRRHIFQCKTQRQGLCQYTFILFWMYSHFNHNMSMYKCHVDTPMFSIHYPIMIWTMWFKCSDMTNTNFCINWIAFEITFVNFIS